MNEYRYDIERCLSMFAAEADKDVVRTCGNCCRYDAEHWLCSNEKAEDNDWHFKEDEGCYYHRTACEQRRLGVLIGEKHDRAERQRISEERETGSGQCEGCPFREKHKEQLNKMWKFVKTVQDMRDTQKAYFKTRDREMLSRSKSLEVKVDVMADEIIDTIGDATPAEE